MNKIALTMALIAAASAFGQADFELQGPACTYSFPIPCGSTVDPEGVSRNAPTFIANSIATVDLANAAGMPCTGSQYARVVATGPLSVPIGGPMPGLPVLGSRLFIPVPAGATFVSFCWDFYLVDYPPQTSFNDGMSVDLVGGCAGSTLTNLAYADAFSPSSGAVTDTGSPCASAGWDVLPAAVPQAVVAPVPAGATFIRVTVWNGGDDFASSHGVIDAVSFATGGTPCVLSFSSPLGPGSVMMDNTPCPASVGLSYFTPVDLTAGTFPSGWFFGLDMGVAELTSQFLFGFPFAGVLSATGASTTGLIGPVPGLSGLTLYAVTTEWTPGYGALVQIRVPVSYTIP
jgi:hypothetical protein